MAGRRKAIELAMSEEDLAALRAIAVREAQPASRVERARMLLAYRDEPSFFKVGRAVGAHHQTVQRCVERALVSTVRWHQNASSIRFSQRKTAFDLHHWYARKGSSLLFAALQNSLRHIVPSASSRSDRETWLSGTRSRLRRPSRLRPFRFRAGSVRSSAKVVSDPEDFRSRLGWTGRWS